MYSEDDLLMISGIQHFIYSERQWALIHVEQLWRENFQTYSGQKLHSRADDPFIKENRPELIVSRSLPVKSLRLGLYGICDVVEWRPSEDGVKISGHRGKYTPNVVEYKRGKAKLDHSDKLQLVAYIVCLEEMLDCTQIAGDLFYFKTKRRVHVEVTPELLSELQATVERMHKYLLDEYTPPVTKQDEEKTSSLDDIVPPDIFNGGKASRYIERRLHE
ncbi:CRISPR-associated protein Cas4 [Lacticaseibacillus zhaodongensis]|uniref:CRISPR-associated protein Cas4 n=1 Tax=Lacticaseibacillus zhaodongensis TaxID=2668065 RepID=UPI0012D2F645|nr:CRISPR-associated protein Cas4 [Lacticaseibacillus zhaodongensis]